MFCFIETLNTIGKNPQHFWLVTSLTSSADVLQSQFKNVFQPVPKFRQIHKFHAKLQNGSQWVSNEDTVAILMWLLCAFCLVIPKFFHCKCLLNYLPSCVGSLPNELMPLDLWKSPLGIPEVYGPQEGKCYSGYIGTVNWLPWKILHNK